MIQTYFCFEQLSLHAKGCNYELCIGYMEQGLL